MPDIAYCPILLNIDNQGVALVTRPLLRTWSPKMQRVVMDKHICPLRFTAYCLSSGWPDKDVKLGGQTCSIPVLLTRTAGTGGAQESACPMASMCHPKCLCVLLCLLLTCNVDSVRLRVYIQREIYVVSIVSGFEYIYIERERDSQSGPRPHS